MIPASSAVRTGSPQVLDNAGSPKQQAPSAQQARRQQTQSTERKVEVRQQRAAQGEERGEVRAGQAQ
ncbi:MAG: hypothetical protein IT369_20060 [Candidatus Latescibacteria bacterium]|nr:hypothetical protein [Candidatus Latescibacterota bacterium]